MKYTIRRTSAYSGKPCEEAKKELVHSWQLRTCSEDEYNRKWAPSEGLWRSKGKNHAIYSDGIQRQVEDREAWVIEINSLEDINKLAKKYGELIISENYITQLPNIEIYDDYR
jgi:hypothetical protein